MTTLIKQRTPHDCGVCCLAMALDLPYEVVHVAATESKAFGVDKGMWGTNGILERLCLSPGSKTVTNDGEWVEWARGYEITPQFFRQIAWGRKSLLSVPSQNIENGWHYVYYDGHKVWDPSNKKTYTEFEELNPDSILVFREGAL